MFFGKLRVNDMSGSSLFWIIIAFAVYLVLMIVIGIFCAKENNSTEDYFLGGRKLGGFVAALSAQASDMSGWLLMGLPEIGRAHV